jgi:hypothetical protein
VGRRRTGARRRRRQQQRSRRRSAPLLDLEVRRPSRDAHLLRGGRCRGRRRGLLAARDRHLVSGHRAGPVVDADGRDQGPRRRRGRAGQGRGGRCRGNKGYRGGKVFFELGVEPAPPRPFDDAGVLLRRRLVLLGGGRRGRRTSTPLDSGDDDGDPRRGVCPRLGSATRGLSRQPRFLLRGLERRRRLRHDRAVRRAPSRDGLEAPGAAAAAGGGEGQGGRLRRNRGDKGSEATAAAAAASKGRSSRLPLVPSSPPRREGRADRPHHGVGCRRSREARRRPRRVEKGERGGCGSSGSSSRSSCCVFFLAVVVRGFFFGDLDGVRRVSGRQRRRGEASFFERGGSRLGATRDDPAVEKVFFFLEEEEEE